MDRAVDQPNADAVLEVRDAVKRYGATIALGGVSIAVTRGEVHALLGENGAGKSTLVKILSGVIRPDAGTIRLDGHNYHPKSLRDARAAGVSTAFQELSLLPNLTVAANLMLPRLRKSGIGLVSRRRNESLARDILAAHGAADIDPSALVETLSLAEKQRVEIIRAVSHKPRLLILDEPTAALAEPEWLFAMVDRLREGGTAILYISHRLGEVRRLCQRGTILRNGRSVGTVDLAGTRDTEIFRMMVGSAPDGAGARGAVSLAGARPAVLRARHLVGPTVRDVSFDLYQGEILGVAALEGQGQRELFRMLAGVEPCQHGQIEVGGRPVKLSSPSEALRTGPGIGFVPEERKTEGIFLGLSATANMSLSILSAIQHFGLIDDRRERERTGTEARSVDLAERYLGMKMSALSGGNQQKALIGRVLLSGARVLVMFDPTRGVDVGTKQVIYGVVRRFAEQGGSVLIYSTEIPELVSLVERCLVIYRGTVVGVLKHDEMSEQLLVAMATGHSAEAAE